MSYTPPAGNAVSILFGRAPNATVSPVTIVFGAPTGASNLALSQQLEAPMQLGAIAAVAKLAAAQALPAGTQDVRMGFVALSLTVAQLNPQVLQSAQLAATAALSLAQANPAAAQDARLGLLAQLSVEQVNAVGTQSLALATLSGLTLEQISASSTSVALAASAALTVAQLLRSSGTSIHLKPAFALQPSGRTLPVAAERRLVAIAGEMRSMTVDESRTFRVPAERRGCTVDPQSRRVRIGRQARELILDSKEI